MLSKNEAKYIQSLFHKKTRAEERVFIAEGEKIINELLHSNLEIIKLYALEEWIVLNPEYPAIPVTPGELKKISNLQNPNKVMAIAKQPAVKNLPALQKTVYLMLDGIQDPGNLGTIIRTADWFGIRNIIASKDTAEVYSPKVIQATMGSFIRVNIFYEELNKVLSESSIPVYGAMLDGADVSKMNPVKEGIIIIGNEGKGIRPELIPFIQHTITIQKVSGRNTLLQGAESLNAAVAAGIILSHII